MKKNNNRKTYEYRVKLNFGVLFLYFMFINGQFDKN